VVVRPIVPMMQPHHVLAAQTGNRAGEDGGAPAAPAEIEGHIRKKWIARGVSHQLQRAPHLRVGQNIKEGGLREAHRKRLLERFVKNSVTRLVGEVREDDGVAGLQCVHFFAGEVQPTADALRPTTLESRTCHKIHIDGEERVLKTCEKCKQEFYGTQLQVRCAVCRITGKKKPNN
jgi:hypothetical protein